MPRGAQVRTSMPRRRSRRSQMLMSGRRRSGSSIFRRRARMARAPRPSLVNRKRLSGFGHGDGLRLEMCVAFRSASPAPCHFNVGAHRKHFAHPPTLVRWKAHMNLGVQPYAVEVSLGIVGETGHLTFERGRHALRMMGLGLPIRQSGRRQRLSPQPDSQERRRKEGCRMFKHFCNPPF